MKRARQRELASDLSRMVCTSSHADTLLLLSMGFQAQMVGSSSSPSPPLHLPLLLHPTTLPYF